MLPIRVAIVGCVRVSDLHELGYRERVYAWMGKSPMGGFVPRQLAEIDAPATIMFQFRSPRRYGVLDFCHTPNMVMDSIYYADDDRLEVIGDKGIIFVNRCTARTVDLPPLLLFRDGKTTEIPVERFEWHDSFIDCTRHLIDVLHQGGEPVLDGKQEKRCSSSRWPRTSLRARVLRYAPTPSVALHPSSSLISLKIPQTG